MNYKKSQLMNYFNLNKYIYHTSPFEYLSSDEIFDAELYKQLKEEFPKIDDFKSKGVFSNENRYDFNLSHIENCGSLSETWNKVIRELTSYEFFKELCNKFNIDSTEYKNIVHRNNILGKSDDIIVDAQFCFNIKNNDTKSTYLRIPHVDSKDKVIVILLYFPESDICKEEDRGELLLYDTKQPFEKTYMNFKWLKDNVSIVDKIKYNHNHGIIFLNSNTSVHAPMSLINKPDIHRRFVNVVYIKNKNT